MKPVRSSLDPIYQAQQNGKVLGNISFGATLSNADADMNMDISKATATAPVAPDTQFAVNHTLGRVPIGFVVIRADRAASVYDAGTAWTKTQIFLKCNVASAALTLLVL